MEVLYLKSQGVSHIEICRLTKVSTETVRNYIKEYNNGGIESVQTTRFRRQASEMAKSSQSIKEYLEKNPVATLPQAAEVIYQLTGIRRSAVQVSKFLKKQGIKRVKVGMMPAKADVEKQENFLKNELEPRLAEAKAGKREVFF